MADISELLSWLEIVTEELPSVVLYLLSSLDYVVGCVR